jgi:hypothetical protein
MKLISEKKNFIIYWYDYIDYCFAVFYYNNLKVNQAATLQSAGGLAQKCTFRHS